LFCFGFLILVIRRFRILVFGKTTNHPSGLQWCPIPTPIWHAVILPFKIESEITFVERAEKKWRGVV
jgi:hypothetical protein